MSFDTLFSKLTLYREKAVKKKNHFTVNTTVKVKMGIKHHCDSFISLLSSCYLFITKAIGVVGMWPYLDSPARDKVPAALHHACLLTALWEKLGL